jgi:acetate kinase
MTDTILVLNAGSSSLKYAVFKQSDALRPLLRGNISSLDTRPRMAVWEGEGGRTVKTDLNRDAINIKAAMELAVADLAERALLSGVTGVGHRIVHGGQQFKGPALLDESTMKQLRALVPFAPMHQPRNIEIIDAARAALPSATQFGCFDTAFHHSRPHLAKLYGLPCALTRSGIMSYGFHGISYAYIASQLKSRFGKKAGGRAIVAHLGSGASLCAMNEGVSVATTMGFSPLDGLVMSTRCGSIDPGIIIHLIQDRGMKIEHVSRLLESESGMLGVSGISGDMQALIESGDASAQEAVDLFVYRAARELGAMASTLQGLDTLVFCAGIGEHSPFIREKIGEAVHWLGVKIDTDRNWRGDENISSSQSEVDVLIIPTDEERAVAEQFEQAKSRAV